jgi:hypothetical protein
MFLREASEWRNEEMRSVELWRCALLCAVVGLCVQPASNAAVVTYDFDTGTPLLPTGRPTGFAQTSNGVTAQFSSPFDPAAFSTQSYATTFALLSQFSDIYLWPNSLFHPPLDILFSEPLTELSLTFATFDDHDPGGGGTPIKITAYWNSTVDPPVGSATASGVFTTDRYPQGILTFSSGGTRFNLVRIEVPFIPQGASQFAVDNIVVTTIPADAGVPEPGSLGLIAIGLLLLLMACRHRRRCTAG